MNNRGLRAAGAAVAFSLICGGAAVAGASSAAAGATPSVVDESPAGSYASLSPQRILDTRSGVGASKSPLGSGKTLSLQVTGRGGVPTTGVSAVVLNLTAVSPTANGYLTAYPAGTSRPTASSVNFNRGWIGANLVTVRVGTGGKVSLYNFSGSVNVVADVMGYYNDATTTRTAYGSFQETAVERLIDSRTIKGGKLGNYDYYPISVDYGTDINPHITALAVNITAVNPTASGYFTAWDGSEDGLPNSSSLNYTKSRVVPNMQIVPTGRDEDGYPEIGVLNRSSGTTDVIVDIVGFYDDNQIPNGDTWYASRYVPRSSPLRIVDTRSSLGATTMRSGAQAKVVNAPSAVADYDTFALVTNTTAIKPTSLTALTLWPNWSAQRPNTSNLNPYAGQIVSNMTITSVAANNAFRIQNTTGTVDVVMDVAGTMEAYPSLAPAADASSARSARAFDGSGPARPTSLPGLRSVSVGHKSDLG